MLINNRGPTSVLVSVVYLCIFLLYLFHSIQHAFPPLPGFGVLPDAVEAGHAVPLPVFQLSVEGVGQ